MVFFETQRTTEDFAPEQLESRLKNRRALGDESFCGLGEESFVVDLNERGINADQLAEEIRAHLEPDDECWFIATTSQGAAIRKIA